MLTTEVLQKEHRLIEQMILFLEAKFMIGSKKSRLANTQFMDTVIEYIKMTDEWYYGKKEDILHRDLDKKNSFPVQKSIVEELIKEHIWNRETVLQLVNAKNRYVQGDSAAYDQIIEQMAKLIKFYPCYIEREYKRFFFG